MINAPNVSRSLTQVIYNNLPENHLGRWFTRVFPLTFRLKPPFDDKIMMLEVVPALVIFDKETRRELYRFQTRTNFQFEGKYSNEFTYGLIHHLFAVAIDEFNLEIKKHKSTLAIHQEFAKPTLEEVRQDIINAIELNGTERTGVKPHWRETGSDFANANNDQLIDQLPCIPHVKQFFATLTTEQQVLNKAYTGNSLTREDEKVLQETIAFYEPCFRQLKQINLFALTDDQAHRLTPYLEQVFNLNTIITHEATFDLLFRVTPVIPEFLDNGKIRQTKWLRYPDLEIVKSRNLYNRANTSIKTVFYASFFENVAIRETKPKAGDTIILTKWWKHSPQPLIAYPICMATEVGNDKVNEATQAFEMLTDRMHPLVARLAEMHFSFWGSEFIKDPKIINPRQYEYFYSAFFSDRILEKFPTGSSMPNFDCMLYPSVAWQHKHNNLAIVPESVDQKLLLTEATEYEVIETFYERKFPLDAMPATLKIIRKSLYVGGNEVVWNDDK